MASRFNAAIYKRLAGEAKRCDIVTEMAEQGVPCAIIPEMLQVSFAVGEVDFTLDIPPEYPFRPPVINWEATNALEWVTGQPLSRKRMISKLSDGWDYTQTIHGYVSGVVSIARNSA
jgi:ubiquitin-protein ligase